MLMSPDIAVGDVLGSCVFNMFILAFLDAFYKPMPVSTKANQGHVRSAGFGILLLSTIAFSLFCAQLHSCNMVDRGIQFLHFVHIYYCNEVDFPL